MFTAEIRINGCIVGILHAQNKGHLSCGTNGNFRKYDYEYYEPSVGIIDERQPLHKKGSIVVDRDCGLSAIIGEIFTEINK
jgi:hypothetical protein